MPELPEFSPAAGPVPLSRGRRALVGAMLAASLACNVAALGLPFMELRKGLSSDPYSLFTSVRMLWGAGLTLLAVLVVAFSVVFPFFKLGLLAWLCGAGRLGAPERRLLAAVDRLGKWSMLDVFLVCLILTLTSGQLLVGAKPLAGLPVFVAAILLSMAAGETLSAALPHAESPRPASPRALRRSGWLLALQGVALLGAVASPFLRIHDWFVADRAYAVATVVPTLAENGAVLPAALIAAFLIAVPAAAWVATCVWWWPRSGGRGGPTAYRLMLLGQRWSMLDVFGLALAVFALEGKYLMQTEVRAGALCLAVLVGIQLGLQAALARAFSRD